MVRIGRERQAGFTLAEVLAAMAIVAVVMPVLVEAALLANRVGAVAERERKAAQLADSKLTELVVTETWRDGNRSGDFGSSDPGYKWQLTTDAWEEDTMRVISVDVSFSVQGREYVTHVSTLAPEEAS